MCVMGFSVAVGSIEEEKKRKEEREEDTGNSLAPPFFCSIFLSSQLSALSSTQGGFDVLTFCGPGLRRDG